MDIDVEMTTTQGTDENFKEELSIFISILFYFY